MLARFCSLPVLLFALLPLAALADESHKEKPKLQEPPITIVSTAIVPATLYRGIITGSGPGTNVTLTRLWYVKLEILANRRLSRVDCEVRWYDNAGNEIFDPQAKTPKGPRSFMSDRIKPGQMTFGVGVPLPKVPGIAFARGRIIAVQFSVDGKENWYPPKDSPMTFEVKVAKKTE